MTLAGVKCGYNGRNGRNLLNFVKEIVQNVVNIVFDHGGCLFLVGLSA